MKVLDWPPRRMILSGALFGVAGLVALLGHGGMTLYYTAFFVFGIGTGLLMPGFMAGASLAAGPGKQGDAAGMVAAMQEASAIIAPLLMTNVYRAGLHIPFVLSAVLIAVSALLLPILLRQPVRSQQNG